MRDFNAWAIHWVLYSCSFLPSYELEDFVKSFAGKPYREILKKLYPDSLTSLNERDIDRLVAEEEKRAIERLTVEAKATVGTPQVLSSLRDDGFEYALLTLPGVNAQGFL